MGSFGIANQIGQIREQEYIQIWDLQLDVIVSKLNGHTETVNFLEELANQILLSCSNDHSIRVWDLKNGFSKKLEAHASAVYYLKALSNNSFASNSHDGLIKIWNGTFETRDYELKNTLKPIGKTSVYDLEVDMERKFLINCCSEMRSILLWDLKSFVCVRIIQTNHVVSLNFIKLNPQTNHLFSGSWDKTIQEWSLSNGECLKVYRLENEVNKIEFVKSS